jgi:hypothetical protein
MSQTDKKGVPHKILVKNKNPGTISTGMNTEVFVDGKPLKYVTFIKFEIKPRGVAKVVIEMLADIELEVETENDPSKSKSDIVDPVSNSAD